MGDIIRFRRTRKRHYAKMQISEKNSYELGLEDKDGNMIPEKCIEFIGSAEFYRLCKGAQGLYIPGSKRPKGKERPHKDRKQGEWVRYTPTPGDRYHKGSQINDCPSNLKPPDRGERGS